jgi:hypothetical protein
VRRSLDTEDCALTKRRLPAALGKSAAPFREAVMQPETTPGGLPLPGPHLGIANARGFWLALDGEILQFDPAHPEAARRWPTPSELPDGSVAMASDGDDLWIDGPRVALEMSAKPILEIDKSSTLAAVAH